jgi:hypothetical protein
VTKRDGEKSETPFSEKENVRESETRIRSSQADGCMGMSVDAWADGMRSVTGKPFAKPAPGSGELHKLVMALVAHCPDVEARVDYARSKAAAFASSGARSLNAHAFVDWLNSGERPSGVRMVQPPAPNGKRYYQVGDGK